MGRPEKIMSRTMSRMLHVSERTIRRDLSEMKHIMTHEGDRNDGKWVIVLTQLPE